MKKRNKKLLTILTSCLLACLTVIVASSAIGCRKKVEQPKSDISFSVAEKNLIIGEEEYLTLIYQKMEGFSLTYSSNNESIVSVNNDGKVVAISEGSAIIKATYSNGTDEHTASITINSSFGGYLPEIQTKGISDKVVISILDTYKVISVVNFNGREYKDANVTLTANNNSIVRINDNGEIEAIAKGTTELIVSASWRGKDNTNTPTMQKVITLSVIDDVRFYNNGKPISDAEIYLLDEFEGTVYENSIPYDFEMELNGVKNQVQVVIEDENILKIEGEKLVANKFGKTAILVKKEVDGVTYSKTFNVEVIRVEKTVEQKIPLFSIFDGKYLDLESNKKKDVLENIGVSDTIVDAYQNGEVLRVENNAIYGVESSSVAKRGTAEISVGTSTVIYHFNLETLAKTISVKEDLKALELSSGEIISGYFEVFNDIDASGVLLNHDVSGDSCFKGIFNGNGHVIDNLTVKSSGLFGTLDSAATIKGIALTNFNTTESYFLSKNTLGDGLTIADVYIQITPETVKPRGLTERTGQNSKWTNIVIEYLGTNAEKNRNYEDSWVWQGLIGGMWTIEQNGMRYARDTGWKDVLIISPFVVSFRADENYASLDDFTAIYGYGANETVDVYGKPIVKNNERNNPNLGPRWAKTTYYNASYTNLYRYDSYTDLAKAKRDLTSFSSEYWVIKDNQVIWKSLVEDKIDIRLYDGNTDIGDSLKIVGVGTTLKVKAFYDGKEVSNAKITVNQNDCATITSISLLGTYLKLNNAPTNGSINLQLTATLTVGNAQVSKTVNVVAIGELVNVATVYDLVDESTGKVNGKAFPISEIIGSEQFVSAYQNGEELTYNAVDGTLKGLKANIVGTGESRTVNPVEITINTNKKVYVVKAKVYSKVIVTANDLLYFNQADKENANNDYGGYYILVNNITDSTNVYNYVMDSETANLKAFNGTFDGNGYSITIIVHKGLFISLGNGAVVKNVAFKDMRFCHKEVNAGSYMRTAIIADKIEQSSTVVTLKDLYISIDENIYDHGGVDRNEDGIIDDNDKWYPYRRYLSKWFPTAMLVNENYSLNSKFSNIIIETNILSSEYSSKGGAGPCLFGKWAGINNSTVGGEYVNGTVSDYLTNVFVISRDVTNTGGLFRITAGAYDGSNMVNSMALSYNDFVNVSGGDDAYTKLYLPNTYASGSNNLITLRRYDDYTAMASDNNSYTLFNGDCWNLSGATPVWKNK